MAGPCIHPVCLFVCLLGKFFTKLVVYCINSTGFAEGPETEVFCSSVERTHVRKHVKCLDVWTYVLAYVKACSQHIKWSELNTVWHCVQVYCKSSTWICRRNWTHTSSLCICSNATRWHWRTCSQFSVCDFVQSKLLRRCWTSSWNNLSLSICVSSTSWNVPSNSIYIGHWSKPATKVRGYKVIFEQRVWRYT